jgi:hypothetical protein
MSLTEGDLEAIAVSEDVVEKRRLPCAEKPESTVPGSLRAVVSVERFEPVFGSGHVLASLLEHLHEPECVTTTWDSNTGHPRTTASAIGEPLRQPAEPWAHPTSPTRRATADRGRQGRGAVWRLNLLARAREFNDLAGAEHAHLEGEARRHAGQPVANLLDVVLRHNGDAVD